MSTRNDPTDACSLMDEFVHEANNRLHSILINVDSALYEREMASYSARFLQAIKQQSNSIALILEAMQMLTSVPQARSIVNVNQTASRAVELAKFLYAKNGIKFTTNLSATQPLVVADRAYLEQCLLYLLEHVVDATPANSQVEVTTEDPNNHAGVSVKISVISAERKNQGIKNIFNLQYSLKKDDHLRLQLGLALAQQIISHFNGNISFQNRDDYSTSLRISFPKFSGSRCSTDANRKPQNPTVFTKRPPLLIAQKQYPDSRPV